MVLSCSLSSGDAGATAQRLPTRSDNDVDAKFNKKAGSRQIKYYGKWLNVVAEHVIS